GGRIARPGVRFAHILPYHRNDPELTCGREIRVGSDAAVPRGDPPADGGTGRVPLHDPLCRRRRRTAVRQPPAGAAFVRAGSPPGGCAGTVRPPRPHPPSPE